MKRILQITAWAAGGFVLVVILYISSLNSKPDWFDGAKLMTALASYARDIKARGEKLPESVTLDELIRRGLLQPEDVSAFLGMKVVIPLGSNETDPQSILMDVTLPDGTKLVAMGDGSVQQETTARTRQRLIDTQPKTPTNPPLPAL